MEQLQEHLQKEGHANRLSDPHRRSNPIKAVGAPDRGSVRRRGVPGCVCILGGPAEQRGMHLEKPSHRDHQGGIRTHDRYGGKFSLN